MGVYETGITSAMQPLALKKRENSLTCPKNEKRKKENFLCIFKIFSLYISSYLRWVKMKSNSAENWGIYS